MKWNIRRQTGLLYLCELLYSFRMVDAVWVIFLLERGYSLAEAGLAEGVMHSTSMICEIPTGMLADLFGRKRTMILSGIAGMCSGIFMSLDGWRGWIYVGMMFSAFSCNLLSGTQEALVYDSLLEAGQERMYRKVWSGISVTGRVSRAAACAMSPVAIAIGYRHTYGVMVVLCFSAVLLMMWVQEPAVTETQKRRIKNHPAEETVSLTGSYPGKMVQRIRTHVAQTVRFVCAHPLVMCRIFADAAIACPCYLILMYLQEHLVNCGWPKAFIGIPVLVISMAGAVGASVAAKSSMGIKKAVLVCGLFGGIGTCLTGAQQIAVILFGACAAQFSEGFSGILVSESVNQDFTSDQRATLVSIDSMMYSVLMVAASPVTGFLGSRFGVEASFYLLGSILSAGTVLYGITLIWKKRSICKRPDKDQRSRTQ